MDDNFDEEVVKDASEEARALVLVHLNEDWTKSSQFNLPMQFCIQVSFGQSYERGRAERVRGIKLPSKVKNCTILDHTNPENGANSVLIFIHQDADKLFDADKYFQKISNNFSGESVRAEIQILSDKKAEGLAQERYVSWWAKLSCDNEKIEDIIADPDFDPDNPYDAINGLAQISRQAALGLDELQKRVTIQKIARGATYFDPWPNGSKPPSRNRRKSKGGPS